MIEIKNNIEKFNPNREVISEEEHKEKVIESATLPKYGTVDLSKQPEVRTVRCLRVSNIYSDEGDFIFEIPDTHNQLDTHIHISRDLMKKLIYDIYLK